jgi:hypothetical protein
MWTTSPIAAARPATVGRGRVSGSSTMARTDGCPSSSPCAASRLRGSANASAAASSAAARAQGARNERWRGHGAAPGRKRWCQTVYGMTRRRCSGQGPRRRLRCDPTLLRAGTPGGGCACAGLVGGDRAGAFRLPPFGRRRRGRLRFRALGACGVSAASQRPIVRCRETRSLQHEACTEGRSRSPVDRLGAAPACVALVLSPVVRQGHRGRTRRCDACPSSCPCERRWRRRRPSSPRYSGARKAAGVVQRQRVAASAGARSRRGGRLLASGRGRRGCRRPRSRTGSARTPCAASAARTSTSAARFRRRRGASTRPAPPRSAGARLAVHRGS